MATLLLLLLLFFPLLNITHSRLVLFKAHHRQIINNKGSIITNSNASLSFEAGKSVKNPLGIIQRLGSARLGSNEKEILSLQIP